eukprot:576342-Prymnesium_polylepis.1
MAGSAVAPGLTHRWEYEAGAAEIRIRNLVIALKQAALCLGTLRIECERFDTPRLLDVVEGIGVRPIEMKQRALTNSVRRIIERGSDSPQLSLSRMALAAGDLRRKKDEYAF